MLNSVYSGLLGFQFGGLIFGGLIFGEGAYIQGRGAYIRVAYIRGAYNPKFTVYNFLLVEYCKLFKLVISYLVSY
jgi:hypothetical protein